MADGHGVGFALLCFPLLRLIALGSTSETLVVWLSLSHTLSFRLGLLQSCDTRRFSGDGGAEGEELDMGYDMPLLSA